MADGPGLDWIHNELSLEESGSGDLTCLQVILSITLMGVGDTADPPVVKQWHINTGPDGQAGPTALK